MEKYNDLELSILSCLLQRPELMKEVILEDKHFIKHKKLWIFLKTFYERFGNFDLTLIFNISKNKYRIIEYLTMIIEQEPAPSLFNIYQKQLIDLYNQKKNEKYMIDKIFEAANELFIGNITIEQFNENLKKIYEKGEHIQ